MQDNLLSAEQAGFSEPDLAEAILPILEDICRATEMGFAAVARVTEDRWIACQVIDKIEFGLKPGDELEIKTTICNDIRESGQAVVIDDVSGDPNWQMHYIPMLYGFESYASFPIVLEDGSFFGTLCVIDPKPRRVSAPETVALLERYAREVARILSAKQPASTATG